MPARLTIYPADRPAEQVTLEPAREYLIGRGPDCDLRFDDDRLSRRHARLALRGAAWRFEDQGSKNGTALAGRAPSETTLRDGDWISFGGLLARFSEPAAESLAAEGERERSRWADTVDRGRRLDPRAGLDALLRQVLDAAMALAGAERGFVMLRAAEGEPLAVRVQSGGIAPAAGELDFPGSRGALARTLASGEPVVASDVSADTLLGAQPSVVAGQIRALACLPLRAGPDVRGLLYLDSRTPGKVFTKLDVEILEAFAAHAALVIGIASVREDLAALQPAIAAAAVRGA